MTLDAGPADAGDERPADLDGDAPRPGSSGATAEDTAMPGYSHDRDLAPQERKDGDLSTGQPETVAAETGVPGTRAPSGLAAEDPQTGQVADQGLLLAAAAGAGSPGSSSGAHADANASWPGSEVDSPSGSGSTPPIDRAEAHWPDARHAEPPGRFLASDADAPLADEPASAGVGSDGPRPRPEPIQVDPPPAGMSPAGPSPSWSAAIRSPGRGRAPGQDRGVDRSGAGEIAAAQSAGVPAEGAPAPSEDAADDEPPAGSAGDRAITDQPSGGERTPTDPDRLRAIIEAVLFVLDAPTSSVALAQGLSQPPAEVDRALRDLQAEYNAVGRGLDLREVADGWRLYTREELAQYVERFVLEGQQARLTQAALETLAVVAYRQPVTRSRVSAIRGVNVDGVMRTLLTRGLVEECGADPDTGGGLYRTTSFFLEKMGLTSLGELPSLAPLLPDTSQLDDVGLST